MDVWALAVREGCPTPPSNIGIYIFVSSSFRVYVGQSSNLTKRKYEHIRLLNKGQHENVILQRSYNKYGFLAYKVIEYLDSTSKLTEREQYWMDGSLWKA